MSGLSMIEEKSDNSIFFIEEKNDSTSIIEEKNDSIRSETVAAPPPPRTVKPKKSQATINIKLQRRNSRESDIGTNISEHSGASTYSSTHSKGRTPTIPGERKQNRLLRQRRLQRERLKAQEKDLYYHFFGTILNSSLALLALAFICGIATTGGLCVIDVNFKIFESNQFDKCSWNEDFESGKCVDEEGSKRCYFSYS